jgi:hypothetical protein
LSCTQPELQRRGRRQSRAKRRTAITREDDHDTPGHSHDPDHNHDHDHDLDLDHDHDHDRVCR